MGYSFFAGKKQDARGLNEGVEALESQKSAKKAAKPFC
jgi:hypothetical protein